MVNFLGVTLPGSSGSNFVSRQASPQDADGTSVTYVIGASTAIAPTTVRVSHTLSPVGGSDRHSVLARSVLVDPLTKKNAIASVNCNFALPRVLPDGSDPNYWDPSLGTTVSQESIIVNLMLLATSYFFNKRSALTGDSDISALVDALNAATGGSLDLANTLSRNGKAFTLGAGL